MFPNEWATMYEANTDDKGMVKAVFQVYPPLVRRVLKKLTKGQHKFIQ